ncbi:MAG: hypothetical protein NTZ11_02860, partial [Gammaproteobacteria bacterium]|nr:hypothetical protein [Gammaproteobacteria bacterium]
MKLFRVLIRVVLMCVATTFTTSLWAQSTEDITAPTVSAVRVLTPVIDATTGAATLTVEVDARDDISGVSYVFLQYISPT